MFGIIKCCRNTINVCICAWIITLCFLPVSTADSEKTVNIGVIVDISDERSASINRSIEIAMTVSNRTKSAKMNPIRNNADLRDSFELGQTICSLITQQTIALFGTSRSETFNIIESYSRALRVPFFLPTLSRETTVGRDNYIISMCPSYIGAVIDFIKYCHWDRIFYLFDTDDALWRLQKLYQAFSDRTADVWTHNLVIDAIRISDIDNIRDLLQKLDKNYNFKQKRIVVDLYSVLDYDKFMSQVVDVGMNRYGYHYVLGTLVEVALTVDAVAVLTTALMQMRQESLGFRRGVLYLHMNCSSDPIQGMDLGHILMQNILNVTLEGRNEGLSGKVAFDEYGNRRGYKLNIFHLSFRSPFHEVGYWEHGVGLRDMSLETYTDVTKEKTLNKTMIVTTILNDPFVQERAEENGKPRVGNDRYEGYCVEMMELLAERINLSYVLKLVEDNEFGSRSENGTWNGLIGELLTGVADIALASLTITRKREQAVYFTKPFMNTGISIMIKKPEKEKPGVFAFMEPLSLQVWGCIIGGFFAVSFILYMVGRFSPYEWQDGANNGDTAPSDTFSFANNIWYTLGALLQQGPDAFPRSLSGRVLASAWWFFTLITVSSYTANLAACLTLETLVTPINSADDLLKQNKIKYGTQKSGSTFEFFKDSKVSVYQQMCNVMKDTTPSVYVEDAISGWNRVVSGRAKYAFMLESSSNNYYNQRKPCKTMKVGQNLDEKWYGIATRKYSALSYPLNIALLEIRERGDLLKLEQKWWYSKGQCGHADGGGKGKKGLNLSNVSGIFHILIGGLVLAVVISLSHLVVHTKLMAPSKKDDYMVNQVPEETPGPGERCRRPSLQHYNTFCDNMSSE